MAISSSKIEPFDQRGTHRGGRHRNGNVSWIRSNFQSRLASGMAMGLRIRSHPGDAQCAFRALGIKPRAALMICNHLEQTLAVILAVALPASYLVNDSDGKNSVISAPTGYDQRQYGYPGFDLPAASCAPRKYAQYSADNLEFVMAPDIVQELPVLTPKGEPRLGPRPLFNAASTSGTMATEPLLCSVYAAQYCIVLRLPF